MEQSQARSGVYLKPKVLRDFFSQEMGRALIQDRCIDIFQGRAPRNVLAKLHSTRNEMLIEIYNKTNLKVLLH